MKDLTEYISTNAIANPDAIAVIHGEEHLTYDVFFQRVLALAERLENIKSQAKVLVDLPQGKDAYLLAVAIMFAGGTYCPLSMAAPEERKRQVAVDFKPDLIIGYDSGNDTLYPGYKILTIENLIKLEGKTLSYDQFDNKQIAYVIYTSGSTGTPKGVMINRGSLNKFLEWSIRAYSADVGDVWSQFSLLSFDLSVVDIFTCLCSGASLLCIVEMGDKLRPAKVIEKFKVTIWHSVPSVIDLIFGKNGEISEDLSSLRLMTFCGEPLNQRHVELAFGKNKSLTLFNTYGPTEGTLFCTAQKFTSENYLSFINVSMSIGEAIPGWLLELMPTEDADIFELIIYGDYIGVGYLGIPDDERFFSLEKDNRFFNAFRTGDLIRTSERKKYFYARKDRQVKINGYRIEPGELDAIIYQYLKLDSFTLTYKNALYTFIESDSQIDDNMVRSLLKEHIEHYKIPREVVTISKFPLNVNAKKDIDKLKDMIK